MTSVLTGDTALSAASPPEAVVRALGSGVHRVADTDAHLMPDCGWPLGRLGAWHYVLTKQSLSSWSWVLSSVPPTLYGLDNCPSLTGLCSGSASPGLSNCGSKSRSSTRPTNLLSGACTWPVPLWGNPKQSLLQFLPLWKLSLVWAESSQSGVAHHRAVWSQTFSSPARAPREKPTKQVNHPRAQPTARPLMAYYSCSFWGLPLPVALETLGLLFELWEAGRLGCYPTRQISKEGEVRSREERPALMEVEQESESGLTCLPLWWWPCRAKETWHFWVFPSEQWSFLSTIPVSERLMHQHRLLHRKNASRKQWTEGHVPGHQEIAYQAPYVREQERKANSLWIKARACPRFHFYSPFPISLWICWLQCLRCYSTQEKY